MATLRWDQSPDFFAASNTRLVPGGPTAYLVPRPTGNSPQDVTDFHPGQAYWSCDNLPNVLYFFRSPAAREALRGTRKPGPKRDQANQIVYERWPEAGKPPRPLLDFRVLPDRIGTKETWWVTEAWRRLDPRIEWNDILMRMERQDRAKDRVFSNYLNMIATRKRTELGLIAWNKRGIGKQRNDRHDKVQAKLSAAQIAANTTRGLLPGLINPALGEIGGRIPCPEDFNDETKRKRGNTKRKQASPKQEDEEEVEEENSAEYEEERSPAPRKFTQGPPRGIFPQTLTAQRNILKRRRDDMPEAAEAGNHDRKKIRTMAPPARCDVLPSARAEGLPADDPHLAEDFARYGITLGRARAPARATTKALMPHQARQGPTPVRAMPATAAEGSQRAQENGSRRRLDPALFTPPPNHVPTGRQHRHAPQTPTPRPQGQSQSRTMAEEQPRAHLPRERAQAEAGPREHLPRGRALTTTLAGIHARVLLDQNEQQQPETEQPALQSQVEAQANPDSEEKIRRSRRRLADEFLAENRLDLTTSIREQNFSGTMATYRGYFTPG